MSVAADVQEQIERYQGYIEADPHNSFIHMTLGDLYHQNGFFDQAKACFATVLSFDPDNSIARGRLANVAISQHQFDEAEHYIKSIPDYSKHINLLNNLGMALCHQQKWPEARDVLNQSFSQGVSKDQLENFKYLIYALHHCDQIPEALEAARAWYKLDDSTESKGFAALLEMDLGDMDGARTHAQEVMKIAPENPNANAIMGYWRAEQQEIDDSRRYFQTVIRNDANNERGWQGLGLAFMYDQNFPEALKCFKRFKEIDPDHVTNYVLMGWCEISQQNGAAAEVYFRQAINADRTFSEAHGGLASALVMQNKQDEARDHIQKAKALDPEGFGAVFAHSILLSLQGKHDMSKNMFAKMMMRTPEGADKPLVENFRTFFLQQDKKQKHLQRLKKVRLKTKH